MFISLTQLLSSKITRIDKKMPVLNNLHIEEDGTTVATNGRVIVCTSPVNDDMAKNIVINDTGKENCTIPIETINEVIKNISKDTLFSGVLEHCNLQVKDNKAFFTMTDAKQINTIEGNIYKHEYINYRKVVSQALKNRIFGNRIVLNGKRLLLLLDTINKMCPDSTNELPLFIEFTHKNEIVIRTINATNGQKVLAVMSSYSDIENKWLEDDKWENSFIHKGLKKLKKLLKKKKSLKKN